MGGVFKGPLRQYSQFLAANIITFGRAFEILLSSENTHCETGGRTTECLPYKTKLNDCIKYMGKREQ